MSTTTREAARRCPRCGGAVHGGGRFVVWCAACDWNVDPAPPEEDRGRLGKARRALAHRHGEQLLAEMTGGAVPGPRRDPAALAAYAIALLVHGVTVLLTAGGTWFIVTGWGRPLMAVGVFLLALAWTLRPRPHRLPEGAWAAFGEFVQVPVEGIERPEDDGDGFIVEWGVWDWTGNRPALSLGRLLAVNEDGDRRDPYRQPQYWKVEFQACFAEDPAWADLHISGGGDSGFDHATIGEPRADALAETRRFIDRDPLLSAMWRSAPIDTEVTLDRAD